MKKWLYVLLAVVILAAAIPLAGCAGEKGTYKIGALFALSDYNSSLGIPEKQTVDMMVEKINANGGINGHKLEVIVYDTKSSTQECVTLATKLIEQDQVLAIIGPSSTGESNALKPIVTEAQIPLISCAAGAAIVTPVSESYWVFKTPQSDILAVKELYKYLRDVKGFTNIAIITSSDGFGAGGKGFLESQASSYGINIVDKETFDPTATSVESQLTTIRNTSAQAIVCWGTSQGAAVVAQNRDALNIDIPLFCSHGVANKQFITGAGTAANGVIFPAGKLLVADQLPDSNPQKSVLVEYKTDYEAEYGAGTINTFGGHAYDALNMVVEALKEVGADKAKIRDYIENDITDWPGTGGIFNMSTEDHNGLTEGCFIMVEIKNGEWTWLQ
jgi:branched-chain amino acid transport system substrate-binding protein